MCRLGMLPCELKERPVFERLLLPEYQGRRHGVDWGGHVHPTFLRSVFIPKQKRHTNR